MINIKRFVKYVVCGAGIACSVYGIIKIFSIKKHCTWKPVDTIPPEVMPIMNAKGIRSMQHTVVAANGKTYKIVYLSGNNVKYFEKQDA
jgi:hypothetical protein